MATANTGMGSGTPQQEIERWLREAGRVTVHDEGEQLRLDGGSTRMYRLYNKAGDSLLVSAETAQGYGLQPGSRQKARPLRPPCDLFSPVQGFIFGEEA